MPCIQEQAKTAWEEHLKTHQQEVDLYKGIADPVEILKIMHTPRPPDPLEYVVPYHTTMEELYRNLTATEINTLVAYVIECFRMGRATEAQQIALNLSALTSGCLDPCLEEFIRHETYSPGMVFRKASPAIRDSLMRRVESDTTSRNHLLLALAWIGDDDVVRLFSTWKHTPPTWKDELCCAPEEYAKEAGWELDCSGQRRDLFFHPCYPLIQPGNAQHIVHHEIVSSHRDACLWCGERLTNVFTFHEQIFSDIGLDTLEISTCERCTCFGELYFELDENGQSHWSPYTVKPDDFPDHNDAWNRLQENGLIMSKNIRDPYSAAHQFLPTQFSQVGGHPTWIQDATYPRCPACHHTMRFLGQISCEDIDKTLEGIYYAFICCDCRITATCYQQT